ncbi:MAG: hypothetical protein IJX46_06160 [Clostridia bacterium]|nr:hypothetical protein [Clostridia bacterium]
MKIRNTLSVSLICLLAVVFCVIGLVACDSEEQPCSHVWGEWSVTKEATCAGAGTQERKCSECGETETSAVAALAHDWSEATCTSPKTCKNCSATEGEALPHTYAVEEVKDGALKSPATCANAAVYYKSCACGAVSTSDSDTFTSGQPLDHGDTDHDHACDGGCGKTYMGVHGDENKDHACDFG